MPKQRADKNRGGKGEKASGDYPQKNTTNLPQSGPQQFTSIKVIGGVILLVVAIVAGLPRSQSPSSQGSDNRNVVGGNQTVASDTRTVSAGLGANAVVRNVSCFKPSDVVVRNLGRHHRILVIDNFFCEHALDLLSRVLQASRELGFHTDSQEVMLDFPGWRIQFGILSESRQAMAQLAMHLGITDAQGQAELDTLISGSYVYDVVKAAISAKFELSPGMPFASSIAEVRSNNKRGVAGVLSMMTRKPRLNIHVDPAAVINIHLSPKYNDTGTAFFSTQEGHRECAGNVSVLRSCRDSLDTHEVFCTIQSEVLDANQKEKDVCKNEHKDCGKWAADGKCPEQPKMMHTMCPASCGVCGGFWEGLHVPRGTDHAGVFKRYHMEPYRFNRLTMYSGHLFHTAYFTRKSISRLSSNGPYGGRLFMQHFVNASNVVEIADRYERVEGVRGVARRLEAGETGVKMAEMTKGLITWLGRAGMVPENWINLAGDSGEEQ